MTYTYKSLQTISNRAINPLIFQIKVCFGALAMVVILGRKLGEGGFVCVDLLWGSDDFDEILYLSIVLNVWG